MQNSIRIAVIGAGAFGRNHLRVLHELSQLSNAPLGTEQESGTTTAGLNASSLTLSALKSDQLPSAPTNAPVETSPPAGQQNSVPVTLVAAVDANPNIRAEVTQRYSVPTFATVEDLLAANLNLHAATVAVPTIHHASVATKLLEANLDVLVEKPITATLAEADALIALAAARNRILAAGHLERFNPSVTAALARLTRPMFFEAHRLSIFTPRSLDVDVVLDLMIHDLDILLTMANATEVSSSSSEAGSPVIEVRAVGLPVLSPKVDIANVRLEFRSGAIANLTASRVSTEQVRKLRLFQPAQYLSLDYARQELLTINVNRTAATVRADEHPSVEDPITVHTPTPHEAPPAYNLQSQEAPPAYNLQSQEAPSAYNLQSQEAPPTHNLSSRPEREARSGKTPASAPATAQSHPSAGLTFDKQALPHAEPLRLELEDFLTAIQTRTQPRVTGQAARNALALALEINAAIQEHARRAGLIP